MTVDEVLHCVRWSYGQEEAPADESRVVEGGDLRCVSGCGLVTLEVRGSEDALQGFHHFQCVAQLSATDKRDQTQRRGTLQTEPRGLASIRAHSHRAKMKKIKEEVREIKEKI